MRPGHHSGAQAARIGLLRLVLSDYRALYAERLESRTRQRVLMAPRFLTSVSLHAVVLIRLVTHSSRWTAWFWRTLLVAKHGIDVSPDVSVGPGLMLPHPIGIVFGPRVVIGRGVKVLHHVSLGVPHSPALGAVGHDGRAPRIEDGVLIYMSSVVVGPITIGEGATIGTKAFVDRDVPPYAVMRGGGPARHERS